MKPIDNLFKLLFIVGLLSLTTVAISLLFTHNTQPKKTNVEHLTITSIEVKTNSIRFNVEITY